LLRSFPQSYPPDLVARDARLRCGVFRYQGAGFAAQLDAGTNSLLSGGHLPGPAVERKCMPVSQADKRDDTPHSGRRISPISLQKHLKGTNYPASKDDLVQRARNNSAPDDILDMIRHLPSQSYDSPADVMRAFGKAQ
jgi:hypothetical protein